MYNKFDVVLNEVKVFKIIIIDDGKGLWRENYFYFWLDGMMIILVNCYKLYMYDIIFR